MPQDDVNGTGAAQGSASAAPGAVQNGNGTVPAGATLAPGGLPPLPPFVSPGNLPPIPSSSNVSAPQRTYSPEEIEAWRAQQVDAKQNEVG